MAAAKSTQQQDWFDNGRQYWDSWFENQKKIMSEQVQAMTGMQGQWGDFFKEWQNVASGPTGGTEALRQFFTAAGQNYINMMEQACKSTAQTKAPEEAVKEWASSLQKFFEGLIQSGMQPYDAAAQYKNFAETLTAGTPGWWAQAFKNPFGAADGKTPWQQTGFLFDPFGFYASMPGIGYTREKQEHLNKLYRLWVDYEAANRIYNTEMGKVGLQALKRFNDYLNSPPAEHPPLQSLKEIYAKWVDISEEVYAEYALSDAYTAMYGKVVNALMAYKRQLHIIVDDMMDQMNLPTRQEIDSLHQRVQELRRENAKLRGEIQPRKAATAPKSPKKAAAVSKPAKKGKKK